MREHEELPLRYFWDEKAEGVGSRNVWNYIKEKLGEGKTISIVTIINFLKAMDEEGVLESKEIWGGGGYRPSYTAKMGEKEF